LAVIDCAALMLMHSAVSHLEQRALSCQCRCPKSYLVS